MLSGVNECWLFGACLSALALCAAEPPVAAKPGGIFFDGETPSFACRAAAGMPCKVVDWRDVVVLEVCWTEDGRLELPNMGRGYYRVRTASDDISDSTFCVVPHPKSRPDNPDSFYGTDAAFSWMVSAQWRAGEGEFDCRWPGYETNAPAALADMIAWCGFKHVRERLSWKETEKKRGLRMWNRYAANARLLRSRGLTVLDYYEDSPPWARDAGEPRVPSDLVATFEYSRDTAASNGAIHAWEFWNEPEGVRLAPGPVWEFTAAMKAGLWGYRVGNPAAIVMHGSIMSFLEQPYQHAMFEGEVWKYIDVANVHSYRFPSGYATEMAARRKVLCGAGAAGFPVWVTENGCWMDGLAHTNMVWRGKRIHVQDEKQEMLVAEHYAKSQVCLQMLGVSRGYYFIFASYFESGGRKDWGMIRRDGTVKPVCAAAATMTYVLADATIEGEYSAPKGFSAYLFRHRDGTQTICFWKESDVDGRETCDYTGDSSAEVVFRIPDGGYRLMEPFGREECILVTDGHLRLKASRHPSYVSGLVGLSPSRAAVPCGTRRRYVPSQDEDLSVVVRLEMDRRDYSLGAMNTLAEVNARECRIKVHVWNLSDEAKTGRIDAFGGCMVGLPDMWKLPAMGKMTADAILVPDRTNLTARLEVGGVFNGKRITPSSARVFFAGRFLEGCERAQIVGADDPHNWRNNSSATSFVAERDEEEGAVKLAFKYENVTDRWAFPRLNLLEIESLSGAKMVEFEIKCMQNKVENDFHMVSAIFEAESGGADWVSFTAPTSNWEVRRLPTATLKNLGMVRTLCLGGLPKGTELTLWFRNIRILK